MKGAELDQLGTVPQLSGEIRPRAKLEELRGFLSVR
jgi:hypothetical protein